MVYFLPSARCILTHPYQLQTGPENPSICIFFPTMHRIWTIKVKSYTNVLTKIQDQSIPTSRLAALKIIPTMVE